MSKYNFAAHCNVLNYAATINKDLAALIENTCAMRAMTGGYARHGVTFLIPDDDYLKEMMKNAQSTDQDKIDLASDQIHSLILYGIYQKADDWNSRKDDIPNALFQKVAIKSATNTKVTFANGATAVPDERFRSHTRVRGPDSSERTPLVMVWKLTGRLPTTRDPENRATFVHLKKESAEMRKRRMQQKTGAYDGGYENSRPEAIALRKQLAYAVELAYQHDRINKVMENNTNFVIIGSYDGGDDDKKALLKKPQPRDAYFEHCMSLLDFIIKTDLQLFYSRIAPVVSFTKFDFYALIEPYRKSGEYLVPDSVVMDWYEQSVPINILDAMLNVEKHITEASMHIDADNQCALYNDKEALLQEIDDLRIQITSNHRVRRFNSNIIKKYEALNQKNTIGSIDNVYPREYAAYLSRQPHLKVLQDELRYRTFLMFDDLEREPTFDVTKYHQILGHIEYATQSIDSNERVSSLVLLNNSALTYSVAPDNNLLNEITTFVNSSHFMHMPISYDEADLMPRRQVLYKPRGDVSAFFNIDKRVRTTIKRDLENAQKNDPVVAALQEFFENYDDVKYRDVKDKVMKIVAAHR